MVVLSLLFLKIPGLLDALDSVSAQALCHQGHNGLKYL